MNEKQKLGQSRPPIVTILGHVDHGKTTLLDAIRQTRVVDKEAGGITQTIGASNIKTKKGNEINFIDTPGHAAFAKMRSRGAKVADVAILVVAADEGIKPQTKEALEYILKEDVPYIVAATKIDLPSASSDKVQSQLEKDGVLFEGRGGDVPLVKVSGKTKEGIDNLLEMVVLVAELNEIKGDAKAALEANVIETSKGKSGPTTSVVVRNGTLKVGQMIVSENIEAKVRGLFDDVGISVKEVLPGKAAQILGFNKLPPVGALVVESHGQTLPVQTEKRQIQKSAGENELSIVVKASSTGGLEALISNLPKDAVVISKGIGDVSETDVFLAKSANASIFTYEVSVPSRVKKLAQTEGVIIESFKIIYKLLERFEELIEDKRVKIIAKAVIKATFPFNGKLVAGCKILEGSMAKNQNTKLIRADKELGRVKIASIKRGKDDIAEAKAGEECGILFTPQLDFKVGDVIVSVRK
jgi:translation initiation factor IF-2